jgi:hypothetical protein
VADLNRRRLATFALVAAFAAACTAASVSNSAPPPTIDRQPISTATAASPSASKPTAFAAEADGYTLTVTADRVSLAPGETVKFSATFHNGTDKPIDVAGPRCGGGTTGYVFVAQPRTPTGKTWTGIRQTFKDYVLKNGMGPGIVPALDPLQINISGTSCSDGTISSELGPGDSVTSSMSWKAEIVAGVDALSGPVPFSVSVGYDRLNGPPSYPPDYSGPLISWLPMFKSLEVKGELEVVGEGRALKGAGEVIDGALADKKYATWLAKRPARTWSAANLFLTSQPRAVGIMPKGPAWELDLFRERGVPRHWAIAFIDPFDASLISVTYCNVPCKR